MRTCPTCGLPNPLPEDICDAATRGWLDPDPQYRIAGFWIRFLADLVEGGLAVLLALPAFYFLDRPLLGVNDIGRGTGVHTLVMLAWFLYMTWLVSKTGQSVGRRLMHIVVLDARTRRPISFLRSLGRNLFAVFISSIFYIGFLWMLFDPLKQTWHDKLFDTIVTYEK